MTTMRARNDDRRQRDDDDAWTRFFVHKNAHLGWPEGLLIHQTDGMGAEGIGGSLGCGGGKQKMIQATTGQKKIVATTRQST